MMTPQTKDSFRVTHTCFSDSLSHYFPNLQGLSWERMRALVTLGCES
jgi:hypothetical protein